MVTLWDELVLRKGLLVRVKIIRSKLQPVVQLIAPTLLRETLFKLLHGSRTVGHWGIGKTLALIKDRFFWPGLKRYIQHWCRKCDICEWTKPGPGKGKSPLIQEISGIPFARIAFDLIVNLPASKEGNKVILVIVDLFTKHADAFPMKDWRAETIAHHLLSRWVVYHSVPSRLHSDRGPELVENVMSQMCEVLGIEKTRTTPYRPQSDGQSERTIKTVTGLLRAFVESHDDLDWDTHIPFVMMAYRATQHSSTGCSPQLMVYGQEMRLPVDLMYNSHTPKRPWDSFGTCGTAYVEWLCRSL